jgi:hypothetical protein
MMRPLIAVASLVLVPALAGCALPASLDVPIATRWAFGAMAIGTTVTVLHGFGASATMALAIAAVIVAFGAARCAPVAAAVRRASMADRAVAALVLLPILAAALFTLSTPVDAGDAVMAWYAKARSLLDWQPVSQLPYAEYPNLGTMAWSLLLRVTGWANEPAARLVFLALYAAFALSVPDVLERPRPRHAIWIVPLALLATFDLRMATNGYQDVPVASMAGVAAVLFAAHLRTGDRARGMLALFFAGTLALIKLEGAVLGGLLVFVWLLVQRLAPLRSRSWTAGLLMFVALLALWPAIVSIYDLRLEQGQYNAFEGASLVDLAGRLSRLPTIARAFIGTGPRFLVPLVALVVLASSAAWYSSSTRRVLAFFAMAAVAHSAWIVAVFLLTNLDVNWHLATALDRLVLQQVICLWTPALIVSAAALADSVFDRVVSSSPVPRRSATHPAL